MSFGEVVVLVFVVVLAVSVAWICLEVANAPVMPPGEEDDPVPHINKRT